MTDSTGPQDGLIAAVDLGSNSFHLVVAQEFHGEIRTLERRGQKVQLAAGLDAANNLSEEAQQRGLACLREFGQRLQGMPAQRISVLATNALRAARNRQEFIDRAEAVLGYPIEVIAGREEARLIYLGVSHTLADDGDRRLVVDIGGGSTEFIIGEQFEPKALESLHMGCVSFTKRHFPDGMITESAFMEAVAAAKQELLNIQANYQALGWDSVVGSSGTIRAAENAMLTNGWSSEGISASGMKKLRKRMLQYKHINDVDLAGVKPERRQVFIGGVAILTAIFETFGIEQMQYSDGALREGALWDLVGRSQHENVRDRVIASLAERFHVDTAQGERVKTTALALFDQLQDAWQLDENGRLLLGWAAQLHEVGLSLSHSGFHKHGAYLLQYSDVLGFTRQSQAMLALLVRSHRRKFPLIEFEQAGRRKTEMIRLARIFRLAVVLNHSRNPAQVARVQAVAKADTLNLTFPQGWLDIHPLTARDLSAEVDYQKAVGLGLVFTEK